MPANGERVWAESPSSTTRPSCHDFGGKPWRTSVRTICSSGVAATTAGTISGRSDTRSTSSSFDREGSSTRATPGRSCPSAAGADRRPCRPRRPRGILDRQRHQQPTGTVDDVRLDDLATDGLQARRVEPELLQALDRVGPHRDAGRRDGSGGASLRATDARLGRDSPSGG